MNAYPHNILSIEKSLKGRRGIKLCTPTKKASDFLPQNYLRKTSLNLPEMSEFDVVRHFTKLSRLNFSLDTNFYPLGSCTMKYNPKSYDTLCALDNFTQMHPHTPTTNAQGTLEIIYNLDKMLQDITGLAGFTLQPSAGAHGEFCGALIAQIIDKLNLNLDVEEEEE